MLSTGNHGRAILDHHRDADHRLEDFFQRERSFGPNVWQPMHNSPALIDLARDYDRRNLHRRAQKWCTFEALLHQSGNSFRQLLSRHQSGEGTHVIVQLVAMHIDDVDTGHVVARQRE